MNTSAFLIYLVGYILATAGLAIMAHLAGIGSTWVIAGALVVLGIGVVLSARKFAANDESAGTS